MAVLFVAAPQTGGGMMSKKIYLAGPDVFACDAVEIGRRKIEICGQSGLQGIFPGDLGELDSGLSRFEQGLQIYDITENMLMGCDAMIVNMTPYHGPSMDAGSAFEMGFMRAQKNQCSAIQIHRNC